MFKRLIVTSIYFSVWSSTWRHLLMWSWRQEASELRQYRRVLIRQGCGPNDPVAGGWRLEVGGWRLEAGGRMLEALYASVTFAFSFSVLLCPLSNASGCSFCVLVTIVTCFYLVSWWWVVNKQTKMAREDYQRKNDVVLTDDSWV